MWEYKDCSELYHYGVRGMRRGIRRFQNPDGSLTAEGMARYQRRGSSVSTGRVNNPVGFVPVSRVRTGASRPQGRTRTNGGQGVSVQTHGSPIGYVTVGKEDAYSSKKKKKKSVKKSSYLKKPSQANVLRGMTAINRAIQIAK